MQYKTIRERPKLLLVIKGPNHQNHANVTSGHHRNLLLVGQHSRTTEISSPSTASPRRREEINSYWSHHPRSRRTHSIIRALLSLLAVVMALLSYLRGKLNIEWDCEEQGNILYEGGQVRRANESNKISSSWDRHYDETGQSQGYAWGCNDHEEGVLNVETERIENSVGSCRPLQNTRRLELLHIPKTGGTSLEVVAAKHNITWGACHWIPKLVGGLDCPPDTKRAERASMHHVKLKTSNWHLPVRFINETANPYADADIFVVVRDPFTRIVSEWNFVPPEKSEIMQGFDVNSSDHMNKWITIQLKKMLSLMPGTTEYHEHLDSHIIPQYLYVEGLNNVHVLKMENLKEEFECLMQRYKYNLTLELHTNFATGALTVANLSKSTKSLIGKAYAKDFETFGYSIL
jgi:Sulfotransferase family.